MDKQPNYSSLFYLNPIPSWVYDLDTFRILDVNEAATKHYGYSKKEFLTFTLKDLRPTGEIPKLVAAHVDIDKKEGNIFFGIFTHQKKNGELIRMEINGHKVSYIDKICMMVICKDVTIEEEHVRQLKESELRLKAASAIAKLGYWRLELAANTLSWSDEVYRIWGRERDLFTIHFENFFQTIYSDDREAFLREQDVAVAGEKELNFIHRIILPDGSIRWVHELGRLVKDENGKPTAIEGTVQDITKHKEAELQLNEISEKLRDSEKRFRIAQEISPDGFTIMHPLRNEKQEIIDFTWVYQNEAIARINGIEPANAVGKRLLEVFPAHYETELFQAYKDVANIGKSKIIDEVYVGDIVSVPTWLRLVIVPMGNDIAILTQDITKSKVVEKALRESEARFRTIFEIASLGIAQVNPSNGQIILVNSYYEIITGYTREELHKMSFVELTHPDDREKDWEIFSKAMRGESEYRNDKRYIKKDGSIVWVRLHVAFIRDEKGKPYRTVAICEDITSQKEEEHRLKLLESVITNTKDSILITEAEPFDLPGPRILYVNEAFTKMTGYTADEVIGKTPRILQGPKSDKSELARLGRAIRNWESCEITTINYKKNGEEFWINFTVTPVADKKRCYTHWIAIERDVTEQKNNEIKKEILHKISRDFSFENDLLTSAGNLCKTISEFGDFDFAELWLPNVENTQILLTAQNATSENAELFYRESNSISSAPIFAGLQGNVLQTRSMLLWEDVSEKNDFIRKVAARKAGINTALGLPLLFSQSVVGVLVIGSRLKVSCLKSYVGVFKELEPFIGSEINRKRLENDLSHMYEAIPDILCLTDFRGRFLKINKAGCTLLGYSEEEILYNSFNEFVHPEDKDLSFNEVMNLAAGKRIFKFENRYITKTGEIVWLSWTCNSALEEGLIYASAKNITEENKLRELNRMTSKLAKIGSWEIGVTQKSLFWSDMVYELHETSPKEFRPDLETAINLYREDFREKVAELVQNSIKTGVPFDFEAVLVTLKQNEKWVRAIGNAEMIDGRCQRIYGSFQDINERKEAELRLQSLADNLPGVVFQYFVYPDGTDALKYVTKGAYEIWEYSPEEVMANIDLVWDQTKAGGDFDDVKQSIRESIKTKSKWVSRYKSISPSGKIRTLLGTGTPIFMADGTVLYNSVVLDITQEAQNEALLEQASEMAKIGSWELDLISNENENMYWSAMTREILEVDENYNPSLTAGFEFYTEEDKQRIQKAVEKLIQEGGEFDEELLIVTSSGKEKWIRCIGKSERVNGKCVKIYGSFQDIHTSKSLEIKIREILVSISDAFYAMDKAWNFTYFNKEAENLLERKADDVLGKNIWELFPAAKGTLIQKVYYNVSETGKSESFEYFYPGDEKWYEINAYPFQGGVSAYFKNIDERKKAKQNLEKAYEEKNKILESIGDAFFTVNKNWIITYWNKEAENFIERKRDELIGDNLWNLFVEAVDTDFYRQSHKAMETGETVSFEDYNSAVNKWIEVTIYPTDEGLSVYFKDVSLRKEADIRLIQANERFEKVTEATNDAIWDWNIAENTLYWGGGYKTLFGYQVDKLPPTIASWTAFIHPDDKDWVVRGMNNLLEKTNGYNWIAEYRYKRNDDSYANVVDRGIIIRDHKGKPIRMVGAMTDISERKQFEQQLLELNASLKKHARELELTNEELEQFAYIASHDLQEPLRMISSFMDQLKRKYENQLDEKALQYIYFATDGAKRMKKIILDLLEYSRAGKFTEATETIDLNELIENYQVLRRKIIQEKSVQIKMDKLSKLESYKAPLTQTLHCLLDNAIIYSKESESPQITVSMNNLSDFWEIKIADNGIGIDPNFHQKIFVIFQRLHNKGHYEGTGIGLSIVKKHVDSWGGKLWLESVPGKGSEFYFTIPKKELSI
ncbi:MAG: PAS domain S-box protein [Balneolales bacterium]|nr:PAS domain S-box protein [Balneolales bacterium]